jgi:hypothetical protein
VPQRTEPGDRADGAVGHLHLVVVRLGQPYREPASVPATLTADAIDALLPLSAWRTWRNS